MSIERAEAAVHCSYTGALQRHNEKLRDITKQLRAKCKTHGDFLVAYKMPLPPAEEEQRQLSSSQMM